MAILLLIHILVRFDWIKCGYHWLLLRSRIRVLHSNGGVLISLIVLMTPPQVKLNGAIQH